MGIQILPQEGSFASNLGRGVGKGISDQLPEEIKRYRLKSGLEGLQNQKNQSPYQQIAALASIPGIDAGLLGVLAPLLQQQQQRGEALGGIPQGGSNSGVAPQNVETPLKEGSPQNVRRDMREGYLQQADENAIKQRSLELLKKRPYSFPTEESARSRASEELNKNYQADVSYQQRLDLAEKEYDQAIGSYLQKEKGLQEGEISGRVRNTLLNRAKDEVASSNLSPKAIGEKYAKDALNIAKSNRSLRDVYSNWNKLYPPTSKDLNSLRSVGKTYQKYDIPQDIFIDQLATTQNISKGAASYIADPIEDTKVGKYLRGLPKRENILKGFFSGKVPKRESPSEIAKGIASKLTAKDPMGSIAYLLRQEGYNQNDVLGELQKILQPDQLTEQQAIDIRERLVPGNPTLDERFLMGFSGEKGKLRK